MPKVAKISKRTLYVHNSSSVETIAFATNRDGSMRSLISTRPDDETTIPIPSSEPIQDEPMDLGMPSASYDEDERADVTPEQLSGIKVKSPAKRYQNS
ncbi:hypothetical protein H0H92_011584, partial [Tricholoma furcatifolium]